MRLVILCGVLVSALAWADDSDGRNLNVPVGYSKTVELPANVKTITLSDPTVVELRRRGRKLTIVGQKQGSTEAIMQTRKGVRHRVAVYVASARYALPY